MMRMFEALFRKHEGDSVKIFEDRVFECFYDRGGRTFSNLEFRRCRFESSRISITRDPRRRSTVRNVKLVQCEQLGCAINTAIIEDVMVDGLKTHGQLLQTWGAVFKHVTLKGNIGRIMLSPAVATGLAKPHEQRAFDEANAAYYAEVDWALDISQARFEECDIRGIPARLIRRDPETQVVVTREKALLGEWRQIDLSGTYWGGWIELFLEDGEPDVVLVAPKRNPHYRVLLDGLKKLRDAGVAEPD
jgi:hypothetical protein